MIKRWWRRLYRSEYIHRMPSGAGLTRIDGHLWLVPPPGGW